MIRFAFLPKVARAIDTTVRVFLADEANAVRLTASRCFTIRRNNSTRQFYEKSVGSGPIAGPKKHTTRTRGLGKPGVRNTH